MRAFHRMTIAQKLWLPTIALCVVIVAVFATTSLRTRSAVAQAQKLQADQLVKSEIAQRWAGLTEANAARVVAGLVAPDTSVADALKADIDGTSQSISELQKSLDAMAVEPEEKQALQAVASTRQAYISARNEAAKLKAAGDAAGALALLNGQVKPAVATYLAAQRGFVKVQQDRVVAMNEAAASERMRLVLLVGGILFALAALLVASTVLLVRSIRQPLRELVAHARRIGEGDLAQAVRAERQDEIGEVQTALAQMQEALRRVVGEVRSAADSIQTASAEVATGNHDLSGRTEQAASSLQQTASSMEQLTGTVSQSTESARTANRLAESAAGVATKGGEVVAQVVSTMEAIEAASKRIGDIIGVIDGIAFQTNILALNAAVEAARAGEQGRGFAVVASEVRSLAQRSADAAKEIKSLIGASVDKVESGSRLVADAGETMTEIVQSVRHVSDLIAEISSAAGEQNSGIGEINIAVTQLDQMTQQNAALVEQSTAAAESLREQAQRLAQVVSRFRLNSADAPVAVAA